MFKDLSARGNHEGEEVELKKIMYNLCSPEDDGSTEKKMKRLTLEPNQQVSETSPTPHLRLM